MLKCISLALMYSMMLQNQLSVENYKPTSDPKSKLLKIKMDNFVVRTGNILLRQVVNSLLFYCFIMHLPYVTNILLKSRLFISLPANLQVTAALWTERHSLSVWKPVLHILNLAGCFAYTLSTSLEGLVSIKNTSRHITRPDSVCC